MCALTAIVDVRVGILLAREGERGAANEEVKITEWEPPLRNKLRVVLVLLNLLLCVGTADVLVGDSKWDTLLKRRTCWPAR